MQRLITEADILAGRVTGPLVVRPGTLITPAARDRAVTLGWAIVEAGESEASCSGRCSGSCSGGCSSACGCACQKASTECRGAGRGAGDGVAGVAGLGDGLYLVRVVGGRTVAVHRAAES